MTWDDAKKVKNEESHSLKFIKTSIFLLYVSMFSFAKTTMDTWQSLRTIKKIQMSMIIWTGEHIIGLV